MLFFFQKQEQPPIDIIRKATKHRSNLCLDLSVDPANTITADSPLPKVPFYCYNARIKPNKQAIFSGEIVGVGSVDMMAEYALSEAEAERARKKNSKG